MYVLFTPELHLLETLLALAALFTKMIIEETKISHQFK
jgi:hypothetical protein